MGSVDNPSFVPLILYHRIPSMTPPRLAHLLLVPVLSLLPASLPAEDGKPESTRFPGEQNPTRVILSPDGKTLVAAVRSIGGVVWDVAAGKVIARLPHLYGEKPL